MSYRIPGYAFAGDHEMIFTPLLASNFMSRAMGHLSLNTDIETRKFGFRDRCSRMVGLEESITFPEGFKPALPEVNTTTNGEISNYQGGYDTKGNTIALTQHITLKKRVYEPRDWAEVRAAVKAQKKMAESPIVLKK